MGGMDRWTESSPVPHVSSLGCSHVDDHKTLDVWELGADKVHLQLPGAALEGGYVELDQGLLLRLQAGHPGDKSRGKGHQSVLFP